MFVVDDNVSKRLHSFNRCLNQKTSKAKMFEDQQLQSNYALHVD